MNKVIKLVKTPVGKPSKEIFEFETTKIPKIKANEFLVKNIYLSMDPALVSRMRAEKNYADNVLPGEVMHAYAVGQVIKSRHPKVKKGEIRLGRFDMQEYAVCKDEAATNLINSGVANPRYYLSGVGVTGATAYFGLFDICQPKKGETIVISAGGSSVGSIAAQLAKKVGCRTVAIVSTDEKAKFVQREWKYDAAVSYRGKSINQLKEDLNKACPNGVDMYFDNTSGDISEALLDLYNDFARIAVIGRLGISHLDDTSDDIGRRDNNAILVKRIKKQGLILLDYKSRMKSAILLLSKWIKQGDIRLQEDIIEGIDQVPNAFFRMLSGKNQGKQLVKLGDFEEINDLSSKIGELITSKMFPTEWLSKVLDN